MKAPANQEKPRLARTGAHYGAGTSGRYGCPMCKLRSDDREAIRDHIRIFPHSPLVEKEGR